MSRKFHPAVQKWFSDSFTKASPPQKEGWPEISSGKNTLILAPTGSGKTLAAFLWCIDELYRIGLKKKHNYPFGVHTLYISPLKALNNDIERNLKHPLRGIALTAKKMGHKSPHITVAVRTGDTPAHTRQSMIKKPPHILITTPESLFLLLTSERGREIFRTVRYLIIDEIHALCGNKRGVHLSLSIERLMTLTQNEPVRIGLSATQRPLERIASYLGGQKYDQQKDRFIARPVHIVDCGQKKDYDLAVQTPVPDFQQLPEASVWPAAIVQLYDLIKKHKTTLVFANMRAQTEKIARLLNEHHRKKTKDDSAIIVFPHHGSMSREKRYEIEERLKQGRIPAVIATASLELGIDIGSIDLVVQLETPRSVSAALQRIGRSGHLLDHPSKGRMMPLYPGDLDDAAAFTRCILDGQIEETVIPENCLDVLAQQIAAEVAMRPWQRADLYNLFRQSYCYRDLNVEAFNRVTEMLNGYYAETRLPALQPRISWDQVNDRLIARRGLRLLAVTNGGTIPDRGYYTVYLVDKNTRIGEMEEEFVFESRVGDIFFLGNNEWRIEEIKQDRIIVSPFQSVKPRAPFWKGELPYRDFFASQQVSSFREEIAGLLDSKQVQSVLKKKYFFDVNSTHNLLTYFKKQKLLTGLIPTFQNIVLEIFTDSAGEKNLLVHAPFGGRINAPWALAMTMFLEQKISSQIQYTYNDDGILIRLREILDESDLREIFRLKEKEIEHLIIDNLAVAPVFAVQFRYNAARALILQRSRPGKRIPLWLQRLRAADLLQAVQSFPDFPVIVETYRACLQDIFDVPNLLKIIGSINNGHIDLRIVQTPYPSPMASGLIFNFLTNQVYELDRTRSPGEVAAFSSSLLSEILLKETIPDIIDSALVKEMEARWLFEVTGYRARDKEDLFEIIEKTGPITNSDLEAKAAGPVESWIEELKNERRITYLKGIFEGWISKGHESLYVKPHSQKSTYEIIKRYFGTHGPVSEKRLIEVLKVDFSLLRSVLSDFKNNREVVSGKLLADSDDILWCDRDNFATLYRAAISRRRQKTTAIDKEAFYKFLLSWHFCVKQPVSLSKLLSRYQGYPFQPLFMEREILRCRSVINNMDAREQLIQAITDGDIIVQSFKDDPGDSILLRFFQRGQGQLFDIKEPSFVENSEAQIVHDFLKENGASLMSDIDTGTGLSTEKINTALIFLIQNGYITCDDYQSVLFHLRNEAASREDLNLPPGQPVISHRRPHRTRHQIRRTVQDRLHLQKGRWFLTKSFAVSGKEISHEERALKQTRLLLVRYGILVKEWYRQERGLLPWFDIFQTLKKLEWQGEIQRGYFVQGLSGIQYAHPEAIKLLEENRQKFPPIMLNITDPAIPLGRYLKWDLRNGKNKPFSITRMSGNHIIFVDGHPVVYSENYGRRIFSLYGFQENTLAEIIDQFKGWQRLSAHIRPRKKIIIESIDNQSAASQKYAGVFTEYGFEKDGNNLVLWPSAV